MVRWSHVETCFLMLCLTLSTFTFGQGGVYLLALCSSHGFGEKENGIACLLCDFCFIFINFKFFFFFSIKNKQQQNIILI